MEKKVKALALAMLSYLNGLGILFSKTNLLKLIYFFDVEFYRQHGTQFSGFDWKFYHLGPWTAEYDELLSELKEQRLVTEIPFARAEFEGVTLKSESDIPLRDAVGNGLDESELIRILNDWGAETTGRLLDYVYFQTEPMEFAERNQPLDFSHISRERAAKYRRSVSNVTPGLIAKRKREYMARLEARRVASSSTGPFTPASYDEEFARAMEKMERLQAS